MQARDSCGLSESPLTGEPGGEFAVARRWKVDQQLGKIDCALELIRAGSIVVFLLTIQFYLQAQILRSPDGPAHAAARPRWPSVLPYPQVKLGSAPATTKLCYSLLRMTYTATLSLLLPKTRSQRGTEP